MDLDCIVVGGGAAGLSAALTLGRARRRTLVLDAGGQSNRVSHGVHGLLGHEGTPPAELYAKGRAELAQFPTVEVRDAEAAGVRRDGAGFAVELADGTELAAPRLLLATGMDYELPALPGIEALWGDTVFHCPFCHGWEVRDQPLAILGGAAHAPMLARMLLGWSDDVVLLDGGLDAEQHAELAAAGVRVEERPVTGLRADDGRLAAITFAEGDELPRTGLLVHTPLSQRGGFAEALSAEHTELGQVVVDSWGATSVPGLYAAGDASAMPHLPSAIADGARAGAGIAREQLLAPVLAGAGARG